MALVTIQFDEHLTKFTNNEGYFTCNGNTPYECLLQAYNVYPALYAATLEGNDLSSLVIILNDEEVLEAVDLSRLQLEDSDSLYLLGIIPSGNYGIGETIMAFVWDAMPAVWAATPTWVEVGINILVTVGIMVALQVVMGALMGDLEMPDVYSGSLDNSASYTFEGIKNTTAAGTPIALVYGTHRTGGQVLAIFTEADDTDTAAAQSTDTTAIITDTYLFAQYGLSEGEIEGISDILINKFPVTYYAAVSTAPDSNYVRYGKSSQDVMPEFDRSMETTSISRKILNASEALNTVPVVYSSYAPVYGYMQVTNWGSSADVKFGKYKLEPYSYQEDAESVG